MKKAKTDYAAWYEQRRNELVGLLDESLGLSIPEQYVRELQAASKKSRENSFEISLVGEFQGGKSTTFNALCDGRDISPRGLNGGGIKTSAAVITAQNLSSDETKDGLSEWAEVTFRSDREIATGMFDILCRARSFDKACLSAIFPEDDKLECTAFADKVDYENHAHRKALEKSLHLLWEQWNAKRESLNDDELDQLRIATLQLRFFGTSDWKKLSKETVLPIDKFQQLIAFPKDWAARWSQGEDASFTIEEGAFSLIDRVSVYLHSKNLERLGCRVTDCPGLFANKYDTDVAHGVINQSDAVWYLIDGEKQIGQKDIEIIKKIKEWGVEDRISATSNIKTDQEERVKTILPATNHELENKGYHFQALPYNARLAFLAMQGNLLLHNKKRFSDYDETCMRIDSKTKDKPLSPSEMWVKMVSKVGNKTDIDELSEVDELDDDAVALARKYSGLDEILGKLESEIIPEKAKSILVDKGSCRARASLGAYEGDLEASEKAATRTRDEWKKKCDESRKQLKAFIDKAVRIVQSNTIIKQNDMWANDLALKFVGDVFDDVTVRTIGDHFGDIIHAESKHYHVTKKGFQEAIAPKMRTVLLEDLENAFSRTSRAWMGNGKFNQTIGSELSDICEQIRNEWCDARLDGNDMLRGIEFLPPNLCTEDVELKSQIGESIISDEALGDIAESLREGLGAILAGMLAGVIIAAITPVIAVFSAIGTLFSGDEDTPDNDNDDDTQEVNKIRKKCYNAVLQNISNNTVIRDKLKDRIKERFSFAITSVAGNLTDVLKDLEVQFETRRVKPNEEQFNKSQKQKEEIAAANHKLRTERIEPLRKRIESFEHSVLAELA